MPSTLYEYIFSLDEAPNHRQINHLFSRLFPRPLEATAYASLVRPKESIAKRTAKGNSAADAAAARVQWEKRREPYARASRTHDIPEMSRDGGRLILPRVSLTR